MPKKLGKVFSKLKEESPLNESKNSIILKCMSKGLKELYDIDIDKLNEII
jgi:hypothetical protein